MSRLRRVIPPHRRSTPMSTTRFLDMLFHDTRGVVEVRALPSRARCWIAPGTWTELGHFVTEQVRARNNIFLGVATRLDHSNGCAANLAELSTLWIDLDTPPSTAAQLDQF